MGHWSESCSMSGMRIPADEDVYVLQLGEQVRYESRFCLAIKSPPIRGKYNEYGSVVLTEDVLMSELNVGDTIDTRDDGWIIVHAGIVESLETLPMDFPYTWDTDAEEGKDTSIEIKSGLLGDWADEVTRISRKNYEAEVAKWSSLGDGEDRTVAELFARISSTKGSDALGAGRILVGADDVLKQCTADGPAHVEEFWKLWRRCLILRSAETEIRHPLIPKMWGPQDGGDRAAIHVAEAVIRFSRRNIGEDV